MGVDLGTRRIGIALTDESRTIAQPYAVLKREGNRKDIGKIMDIVQKNNVIRAVVGVAADDSGVASDMGRKALAFGRLLSETTGLSVVFVDEAMTTVAADEALRAGGIRGPRRKGVVDKVAAAIILESYLRRGGHETV